MCDMLRIHNTAQLPRSDKLISWAFSNGGDTDTRRWKMIPYNGLFSKQKFSYNPC